MEQGREDKTIMLPMYQHTNVQRSIIFCLVLSCASQISQAQMASESKNPLAKT